MLQLQMVITEGVTQLKTSYYSTICISYGKTDLTFDMISSPQIDSASCPLDEAAVL
jgi:hypothetical protein